MKTVPGIITWSHLDKKLFYTLGPMATLLTRFVVYPMNLIKTQIQMQRRHAVYNGTFDAFSKILRSEGPRGLYRGFSVNSLAVLNSQLYVTIYELLRQYSDQPTYLRELVAGGVSSFVAQTMAVPIDVVSQTLMVQGLPGAKSSYKAREIVSMIYKNDGLRGFFRGYTVSLLTFVPSSAVWWLAYTNVRHFQIGDSHSVSHLSFAHNLANQGVAGIIAGAVAAVVTNPIDVVRTRIQTRRDFNDIRPQRKLREVIKQLFTEEGLVRGLTKGVTARILHTAPSSTLMILSYEAVKRFSYSERL